MQAAFLQRSEHQGAAAADQPSVRVSVVPAPPPDPSLKVKMDDIEQRRSKAEGLLFEQARLWCFGAAAAWRMCSTRALLRRCAWLLHVEAAAEMKDLTRVVLAELQAVASAHRPTPSGLAQVEWRIPERLRIGEHQTQCSANIVFG